MLIETQRLIIQDLNTEDEMNFVEMVADGSLYDCGFDKDCSKWITKWIIEAQELANRDNPNRDYVAYTIITKNENTVVGLLAVLIMKTCKKQVLHILLEHNTGIMVMWWRQLMHIRNIFLNVIKYMR